jgi:RNA polymerase sigma factor (sigma-70 family)
MQEACIRALRLQDPELIVDPVRYIRRIARNLSVDRQRRLQRESNIFDPEPDARAIVGDGRDPERIVAAQEALRRALATIEALPPRCREAFKLHRFEGLSYAAVSRRMGISVSMVEKHIAEAMLRLIDASDGALDSEGSRSREG